ncbi:hypothetical protein CYMTET_48437 [Cymbomonas tetramitiformis]|uniref:H(+)-exporting diphosphatase n=1 Tax=Cymbomonas tetramitiformis TaxID=36881 RepID=A0AAE0BTI0_9CHLO|nr:hypothetical protein CYMTET_48437 [Cymbomonas tetramitiformis]
MLQARLYAAKVGKDIGHPVLDRLAGQIKSGSMAFLAEEYKYLGAFCTCLALVLVLLFSVETQTSNTDGIRIMVSFLAGAILSATAGYLGMMVATDGNVRTTVACTAGSLNDGLTVAFTTGSIMGFTVVGLGLLGLSSMYLLVGIDYNNKETMVVLTGFGFGASAIALFARVAGGIYTKAADVGADLVGKVEAGIDEDDPHNPAVIADNVGDNVGDVAGMGADLFESYVGSIIAAASLAESDAQVALPFWIAGAGIICSAIGFFFVQTKEEGAGWNSNLGALMFALEKGMYGAGIFFLGAAAAVCHVLGNMWDEYLCIVIGLVAGMAIGKFTEYFTSLDFAPVMSIKDRGVTGPATVIIQGLGVGMISCVPTVVILCITIIACDAIASQYGVAIAAVGMLATLGITLATDAYGPVADNAGGLAEMDPSVPEEVRHKTDALDALGNTTAATGKGFAIGSAVLTSLSLLAAFKDQAGLEDGDLNLADPIVLSGVLFGSMLPFMFAALTMISVGKAAAEIIQEVRRQFRENPKLKECILKAMQGIPIPPEEDTLPDSDRCVAISTKSSVREMVAPGCYAILAPLFVGFLVGPRCLVGVLSGAIASGCMLAIMMSNAGGAWDNGKKLCEKLGIKATDQGKACVVGDTVGDPFKDTSGPALNILIKLMSMVSLTVAPLIKGNSDWDNFYWGIIPFVLFLAVTYILVQKEILTWKDPLESMVSEAQKAEQSKEAVEMGAIVVSGGEDKVDNQA